MATREVRESQPETACGKRSEGKTGLSGGGVCGGENRAPVIRKKGARETEYDSKKSTEFDAIRGQTALATVRKGEKPRDHK